MSNTVITKSTITKHENLQKKLNFMDFIYNDNRLRPKLLFYRYLAPVTDLTEFPKSERLNMNIPITIVYDGLSSPFWLYTKDGYIYREDAYNDKKLILGIKQHSSFEAIAVSQTVLLYNLCS